jgi:hypothetical protein
LTIAIFNEKNFTVTGIWIFQDISGHFRVSSLTGLLFINIFQDISGHFRTFQQGCVSYWPKDLSGHFRILISGHFRTFQDISRWQCLVLDKGQIISGHFRIFQDISG